MREPRVTATTCVRACKPVPITPSVLTSSRARYLLASPDAAPVRICPSQSASISASGAPSAAE